MAHAFTPDASFGIQRRTLGTTGQRRLVDLLAERERPEPEPAAAPTAEPEQTAEPPRIDEAELQRRLELCATEVRAAALAEARSEQTAALARAAEAVAAGLGAELARRRAGQRQDTARMLEIVAAVARRVVPAAAAKLPVDDLASALQSLCARLDRRPEVTVAVARAVQTDLAGLLPKLALEAGFDGRIEIVADDRLAPGDARVDWVDGRAERRLDDLVDDALAVCAGWLDEATTAEPAAPATDPKRMPS